MAPWRFLPLMPTVARWPRYMGWGTPAAPLGRLGQISDPSKCCRAWRSPKMKTAGWNSLRSIRSTWRSIIAGRCGDPRPVGGRTGNHWGDGPIPTSRWGGTMTAVWKSSRSTPKTMGARCRTSARSAPTATGWIGSAWITRPCPTPPTPGKRTRGCPIMSCRPSPRRRTATFGWERRTGWRDLTGSALWCSTRRTRRH